MIGRARHLLQPGELVGRADQRIETLLQRLRRRRRLRQSGSGGERDAECGEADGNMFDHRLRNSAPTAMVMTVAIRSIAMSARMTVPAPLATLRMVSVRFTCRAASSGRTNPR